MTDNHTISSARFFASHTPAEDKQEFILTVHKDAAPALGHPAKGSISNNPSLWTSPYMQGALAIRQRQYLDKCPNPGSVKKGDANYLQLLPYVVFCTPDKKVFTYSRGKHSGEARLQGDRSAGYGGHIDIPDIVFNERSGIEVADTILKSAQREIEEELQVVGPDGSFSTVNLSTARCLGTLFDESNEVGCLHLGIVLVYTLPRGAVVKPSEADTTEHGKLVELEDLLSPEHESWTRLVAQRLLDEANG